MKFKPYTLYKAENGGIMIKDKKSDEIISIMHDYKRNELIKFLSQRNVFIKMIDFYGKHYLKTYYDEFIGTKPLSCLDDILDTTLEYIFFENDLTKIRTTLSNLEKDCLVEINKYLKDCFPVEYIRTIFINDVSNMYNEFIKARVEDI